MTTKVMHSFPIWLPQTQTWMYNQIRYLPSDIEAHVVCEKTENLEQFYLPNIHSLSTASRIRYYWDKGLIRLGRRHHLGLLVAQARRNRANIIHSHFGHIGWQDIQAVKSTSTAHVVTFYGFDVNKVPMQYPVWHARYQDLFREVDQVLCEGTYMASSICALGCKPEKVKVQHLGIEADKIPFKPRQWSGNEPLRILISASFREKKGIPYALEALAKLKKDIPLSVTIIGDAGSDPSDQNEKKKILQIIGKYEFNAQVRLLGYQPHSVVFEEAYQHHIFLSPSVTAADGDTEGGAPVSLAEMAATGMPIVSSIHCDIPEVIKNGVTGLLAAERDTDQLASHIRLLAESPTMWPDMLFAGRKHIEHYYDARVQGAELGKIYKYLAG